MTCFLLKSWPFSSQKEHKLLIFCICKAETKCSPANNKGPYKQIWTGTEIQHCNCSSTLLCPASCLPKETPTEPLKSISNVNIATFLIYPFMSVFCVPNSIIKGSQIFNALIFCIDNFFPNIQIFYSTVVFIFILIQSYIKIFSQLIKI